MSVVKPAFANRVINIRSEDIAGGQAEPGIQAVSQGCELVAVKLVAGGTSAFVRIYDDKGPVMANSKIPMAAEASNSDDFCPTQPVRFTNGIYIVFEQGGFPNGNAEICLVIND